MLREGGPADFSRCWNRAWLPFALIPLGLFALSPGESSLIERGCLCAGQAQLHHHRQEQMGKKGTVQPTVPPCVIRTWCQASLAWFLGGSCQAKGCCQH